MKLAEAGFWAIVGEGPVTAHPEIAVIAWGRGRDLFWWTPADGPKRLATLADPIRDVAFDGTGSLWSLDGTGVSRWVEGREAARVADLDADWFAAGEHGLEAVHLGWMDGFGPVTVTTAIHPDGTTGEARARSAPHPPRPERLTGTADGRFIVADRDGLRAIWELVP